MIVPVLRMHVHTYMHIQVTMCSRRGGAHNVQLELYKEAGVRTLFRNNNSNNNSWIYLGRF